MFDWLKRLLHGNRRDEAAAKDGPGENKRKEKYRDEPGMITRTCKKCGKTADIPAGSTLAANAFLHCDEITLT